MQNFFKRNMLEEFKRNVQFPVKRNVQFFLKRNMFLKPSEMCRFQAKYAVLFLKRNMLKCAKRNMTLGSYSCQLDEQWFDLTKDTLRDALQITPVDNNNAFSSPPTLDVLIKFVNDLGYPKVVRTLSDVVTNDMFQPWRALTTIINLCLTGKTSGFERPRAPVLQILWGVVKRAHIDYAKRMWEEFTQSIHTFIEDKKNLAQHTQGKKKATLIVIPSVRFTKLIIHHLQSKHKFHPRPGSPLHLPNEEPVLGYLKFSAKGTKREVFGMPIPNNLITADIQGEQYYNAYLEKVAKHQRYLAGEEVSDPDSPAPKPAKATKPKATKQSKPLAPKAAPVTKPAAAKAPKTTASRPPKPTPATTEPSKKDQSKKRKLVKESSEAPSPAKRPKAGKVIKKRTQKSSLQLVDEFVDEGVPVNEPRFGDEEADLQKAVEESLKDVHAAHQGPLPPVVIREPESGKFQPLPEVQGKGKEKVGEEQAAQVLLNLQTPKKKSPADQNLVMMNLFHCQAGSNPGDAAVSQPQPSHVVHVGPNLDWTLSFTNQFLKEKSQEDEPEKTNTESDVHPHPVSTIGIGVLLTIYGRSVQDNLALEERLDKHGSDCTNLVKSCDSHQVSKAVDEIVTDAVDWAIQAPLRDRFRDLPEADMKEILHHRMWETKSYEAHKDHKKLYEALEKSMDRPSRTSGASRSSQLPLPPPPPPTNQSDQLKPSVSSIPEDLHIDADSAPDEQVPSSDDEDIGNDHIPKVIIQSDFLFNKDLEYLRYGSKGSRPALSISKMKASYYHDVGLKQMVPDQMWIEKECKHTSEKVNAELFVTHMRILSFVQIKFFSLYGYDYIKNIVLRRADLQEYIIAERDFKYLYPSDFEDLYLLNLQGHLNHLPPTDKKILTTAVNLWTRNLVIRQRVEDFQLGIESYQTQLNLTKP
ncbi:retrovirus-related pol polyprotein from transposon TNT 1-94 [Tanacetum coccineum]